LWRQRQAGQRRRAVRAGGHRWRPDRRCLAGGGGFPRHHPRGGPLTPDPQAFPEYVAMLLVTLNILFVLVAIAMIALILMQRGAGAAAGSGFGGGASATVFGARGSSSFLTKATKWLAIAFFAITLFMAWYATRQAVDPAAGSDLGVMSQVPAAPVAPGASAVPAVPAATSDVPVPPQDAAVPPAPVDSAPAPAEAEADPAAQTQ